MRGKHALAIDLARDVRITPAHAGKTQNQDEDGRAKSDHPRTCGENVVVCGFEVEVDGSPPHMRGKPLVIMHPLE